LTNKIPNILGGQLKNAREKAGLSLESVAKTSTLSNKQLEEIESGGDSSFIPWQLKSLQQKKSERYWA
jgi:transcriptional regulator with XRE-family HTH domain